MTKLTTTAFLVLTPTKRQYAANAHGVRPVTEFKASRLTQNRPPTKQGEIATRVNITIDASLFDKIAPVIDIELEEGTVFANVASQVSINAEEDAS